MAQHGRTAGLGFYDSSTAYRNVTGYLKSIEYNVEAETNEVTVFSSSNKEKSYVAGNTDGTISVEGVWDPTVDGYFYGVLGKQKYVHYFPASTNKTNTSFRNYKQYGILTSYSPPATVDDANTFSAEWQMTGVRTRTTSTG